MAHEFGHVLGLGDAYTNGGAPVNDEIKGGGWLVGDIMRSNGPVRSNNIEMVLEAFKMNKYQMFPNEATSPNDVSKVIRLPK